jgi:hypothetical protein
MRDPNAQYDGTLNGASAEQELVAKTMFELVQEIRRQAGPDDPDSPGQLTPIEILQIALAKVPAAAPMIVAMIRDTVPNEVDAEAVGHILFKQLY